MGPAKTYHQFAIKIMRFRNVGWYWKMRKSQVEKRVLVRIVSQCREQAAEGCMIGAVGEAKKEILVYP